MSVYHLSGLRFTKHMSQLAYSSRYLMARTKCKTRTNEKAEGGAAAAAMGRSGRRVQRVHPSDHERLSAWMRTPVTAAR